MVEHATPSPTIGRCRSRNGSPLGEDYDIDTSPQRSNPMFVQVIKGHTNDQAGLRRQLERWRTDLKPSAVGFEGSTVGIAADGTLIALARFADAGAARKNSDRAEQGVWWEETAKFLDAEPTFRESSDTATLFG